MNEDLQLIGARAIAEVVRNAVENNPAIEPAVLNTLAETAAAAITAGLAKLRSSV